MRWLALQQALPEPFSSMEASTHTHTRPKGHCEDRQSPRLSQRLHEIAVSRQTHPSFADVFFKSHPQFSSHLIPVRLHIYFPERAKYGHRPICTHTHIYIHRDENQTNTNKKNLSKARSDTMLFVLRLPLFFFFLSCNPPSANPLLFILQLHTS